MKPLNLQSAALVDLQEIYEFSLAKFGVQVAEAYLIGLRHSFTRILEYPQSGRIYPNVKPEIRLINYRQHRIFYQAQNDATVILRILHGSRDERRVFG